ncbi:MAG: hypothetical protein ACR2JC_08020 [Chloroflexota bacterium]|nr:MAG: hypothetical protein DLM70_19605 [Chloroflexota bacterium]
MQTAALRLRPLSLGDLLDTTFALYRQNFALLAGIVAVLTVPQTLLGILFDAIGGRIAGSLVTDLLAFLFSQLITGSLAIAISRRYLDESVTIEQAYATVGVTTFLSLLGGVILYALIVAVGFVFLIIPGIYLSIRLAFYPQGIVIERLGIFQAFARSGHLVKGTWWRVFGILIVLYLLTLFLELVAVALATKLVSAGGSGPHIVGTIISAVVAILVQPVLLTGLTLLYYDLRIRKEGFDIEHLASHMRTDGRP